MSRRKQQPELPIDDTPGDVRRNTGLPRTRPRRTPRGQCTERSPIYGNRCQRPKGHSGRCVGNGSRWWPRRGR